MYPDASFDSSYFGASPAALFPGDALSAAIHQRVQGTPYQAASDHSTQLAAAVLRGAPNRRAASRELSNYLKETFGSAHAGWRSRVRQAVLELARPMLNDPRGGEAAFGRVMQQPSQLSRYERLFAGTKKSKDGKVAQLSLRGRRQLARLERLRAERIRRHRATQKTTEEIASAEVRLSVLKDARDAARAAYLDTKRAGLAGPKEFTAWTSTRLKFERAAGKINRMRAEVAQLTEDVERLRGRIRLTRAALTETARQLRTRLAHLEAAAGNATAAQLEATAAVAAAAEAQQEAAEAQTHDERAAVLAQFKLLQDAFLSFTELRAKVEGAAEALALRGDEVTEADKKKFAELQAQLTAAATALLAQLMAMAAVDLSPLSRAGEADDGDSSVDIEVAVSGTFGLAPNWAYDEDSFGVVPNWAYDYDNTAQFGNNGGFRLTYQRPTPTLGSGNYAQQLGQAAAGSSTPPAPQQQSQQQGQQQQPQMPASNDPMGWVNTIGNVAGSFMQGLGSIIGAAATNQNLSPQQQQNLWQAQQGMHGMGTALAGGQPVPGYPGQQPQSYPSPPPPPPATNWKPWAFGTVAVLGLGALTWALLGS